jgi:uncharacterized protein YdhG (YjbR/CyaY superfamily)
MAFGRAFLALDTSSRTKRETAREGSEEAMQSKAKSVDAYLKELPEERRRVLKALRALVGKSAPNAKESMRYGMPVYDLGEMLCAMAAQKGQYSFYVADTKLLDRFRTRLGKLSVGKSCIRFKTLEQLPLDVLGQLLSEAAARQGTAPVRPPS